MRTKALILSAALGMAGIASSYAQVYSVNVVGYINLPLTNTWSLIGNQLDDGAGNQVTNLFKANFPAYPVNFYKYNGATYDQVNRIGATLWTFSPNTVATRQMTLAPGEALFVRKPAAATQLDVTFVGEVMQGTLVNPVTPGFELYSTMVPQEGGIRTVHNFQPNRNDQVFFGFNGTTYQNRAWLGTVWAGTEPSIKIGEGFWINSRTNIMNNWTRTFQVN